MRLHAIFSKRVAAGCLQRKTIVRPQGGQCHKYFTSSAVGDSAPHLPFSFSNLGLKKNFILPTLNSIRQLPEVENALVRLPSSASVDELSRAVQVFDSINGAHSERLAVRALLAEHEQYLAHYDKALDMLKSVGELIESPHSSHTPSQQLKYSSEDVALAQAKVLWFKGEFDDALEICESMIQQYNDFEESFPATNLHMASAMSGKALCQLASMDSMDDAYSVRDYFRITIKFLQRHPSTSGFPEAVALHNCGVAEAVYAGFLEENNDVTVPLNAALKSWFQGLQRLEGTSRIGSSVVSELLKAKIQANLAWGVLNFERDQPDYLSKASEYAGKSLAIYDKLKAELGDSVRVDHHRVGLTRTLAVLASYFYHMDNAITSEGLYQSALDKVDTRVADTFSLLEVKDAYNGYAELCSNWDKRQSDARRLEEGCQRADDLLPGRWKGKSVNYSSLWFWTPGDVDGQDETF